MDANWRWIDNNGTNCYTGNEWNSSFCPDPDTCAQNCALEGVPMEDWTNTYGVMSTGDQLRLNFVTQGQYSKNVGSRVYMLNGDDSYEMFKLKNQEFSFQVDVSNLPCGLNGALYFVDMPENGDYGVGHNQAGAKYGTGYCDAQCPHDIKFMQGQANVLDWQTSGADTGTGKWGSCCAEVDIWEANSMASAYTMHPCSISGNYRCESASECGDDSAGDRFTGVCDKDGCDLNPFRAGVKDYFGQGLQVDTTKPFRVVTQFFTDDNTENGTLTEVKRFFVQNGKKIEHPMDTIESLSTHYNSISDEMCTAHKTAFGDTNDFANKGGMGATSKAMDNGMVLVLSLWDDHAVDMLWLDSTYPVDKTSPGGPRGTCGTDSGKPEDVENNSPGSHVLFSGIRIGDHDSTWTDSASDDTLREEMAKHLQENFFMQ